MDAALSNAVQTSFEALCVCARNNNSPPLAFGADADAAARWLGGVGSMTCGRLHIARSLRPAAGASPLIL